MSMHYPNTLFAMSAAEAEGRGRYPTTIWSEVRRAGSVNSEIALAALDALLKRYYLPLKDHLKKHFRLDEDQAQDCLHDFLHQRVILGGVLRIASENRGKFRTFLLNILDKFAISQHRRESAQCRRPKGGYVSLEELPNLDAEPACDSLRAFAIDWARTTLGEVLRRMEAECRDAGDERRWELFKTRVLEPKLDGTKKPPCEETVARLGFSSEGEVYKAQREVIEQYHRILHEVVAEYVGLGEAVEDEVRELKRIIGGG
jgi:hypothetical protein